MTTLNIRIEENIKAKASKTLASLGLDMSTAVKMFLNQVVTENGLPFVPSRISDISSAKARALRKKWDKEIAYELKYGKSYKNFKELWDDIK